MFAFDQRTAKQAISIEIFLSITKILTWFDVRNYEKRKFWFKYLVQFLSFWQLFLLKWLQSPFSWGQVLMKHWVQFLSVCLVVVFILISACWLTIIYWVTDLSRKVLPFNENEIPYNKHLSRCTKKLKWWFTLLHLDEKKEDLTVFWRNERYEAKPVTKCLRQ